MNDDEGQRLSMICGVPAAPAADLNAGSDFHEPLFGRRKMNSARREETGERLYVTAP